MNLSSEVTALESDNAALNAENASLNRDKIRADFEISQLKARNLRLESERDEAREAASELRGILNQVGASIVHGMNRINAARDKKKIEAEIEESAIAEIDNEPMPLFLQNIDIRDHSEPAAYQG